MDCREFQASCLSVSAVVNEKASIEQANLENRLASLMDSQPRYSELAKTNHDNLDLPNISPFLLGWFRWYIKRFIKKSFHSFCISKHSVPDTNGISNCVILGNHSSWWDPLVAMYLAERFFPQFQHFSPIDADALNKYKIFRNFGFYGVDQTNRRGAVEFLKTSDRILAEDKTCIWITPEGKFVDVRDHAQPLEAGASHLAARTNSTIFLPLAIELCFWEEKQPELFCRFGNPISSDQEISKSDWSKVLNAGLRTTQSELAEQVISRDDSHFEIMIGGAAGVNWAYDSLRRISSFVSRKKMDVAHGKKLEGKVLKPNEHTVRQTPSQLTEAHN